MGELHLDIIVDRMKRTVEANIGKPQVAYRETIKNSSKIHIHIRNNLVAQGSTVKLSTLSNPANLVVVLFLNQKSLVVMSLKNFGRLLRTDLKRVWVRVFWQVIPVLILK